MCSMVTVLTSSWRSSGQDMWLCGLCMANSKSGYYNLLSSCQVLEFPGWSKCWFQKIEICTMYRHIPLDLNLLLDIEIHDMLQVCIMNSCHGQCTPLLAGPLSRYPQYHNGLAPSKSGHGCLCRSVLRGGSWYFREGFQYLRSQSPASKTLSQSRLQHRAVPMIVQCQGDGLSLSSKHSAVIWESFGQLAASRLTILEMAADDWCCPHSLINLISISVDFIMLS